MEKSIKPDYDIKNDKNDFNKINNFLKENKKLQEKRDISPDIENDATLGIIFKDKDRKDSKWERMVKDAVLKREEIRKLQTKREMHEHIKKVQRWLSIPIILSIISSIIMIHDFGFKEYERNLLGWVIGTIFISIIITVFESKKD